ncbi:hypothetical protein KQI36_16670 [Clostridium senegalense]|uniref:hypothetical protein n=1 Tax=Clostridium senegalense TaxID=1465809 RepID=UPI001C10B323|nr:hypothetical protein [Clostridium senegalense]MBU5228267.1 hypothetical protein [Clostridium senegalense]
MSNFIMNGKIVNSDGNFSKAKIKDLKYFIRDYELDETIFKKLPLELLGKIDNDLPINGSKELIDLFEKIDAKKIDIPEVIENINFNGVTEENEIILNFVNDDLVASGVYNFTYQFFEELFDMGKYEKFCFENNLQDVINENIVKLFEKFKETKKQYRLIEQNEKWYLRGITSIKYNNYDNNIAIYITMLLLSKLSIDRNIGISVKSAYISDSDIKVFFEQDNYKKVDGVGNVYFGVLLTNGEIRNSQFSLEVYYRIEDENLSFTAIPELKDSIFSINHTLRVDWLITKVQKIDELINIENSMLKYIKAIKDIKVLSENVLYNLMLKITQSRILISETKENFKNIYDKNLINNSMTLLQVFDKVDKITIDIDEKIYLQRIYNEIIKDLTNR